MKRRSSADAYPEPNSVSARVTPKMCGTPKWSHKIIVPGRGVSTRSACAAIVKKLASL